VVERGGGHLKYLINRFLLNIEAELRVVSAPACRKVDPRSHLGRALGGHLTEAVRHEREISNAGNLKLDFAERYKCKPVLLRLSLAGNLEKPLMSLYGTEWRERGYGLRATAMRNEIKRKKVHSVEKYWVNALFAVVLLGCKPPPITSPI
jgi:hypothetical protein